VLIGHADVFEFSYFIDLITVECRVKLPMIALQQLQCASDRPDLKVIRVSSLTTLSSTNCSQIWHTVRRARPVHMRASAQRKFARSPTTARIFQLLAIKQVAGL
jgi:hypothetical protein